MLLIGRPRGRQNLPGTVALKHLLVGLPSLAARLTMAGANTLGR
ncbi:MAG: hypothetical protein ACHQ2F_07385 [Desulfobaccales bacterium]